MLLSLFTTTLDILSININVQSLFKNLVKFLAAMTSGGNEFHYLIARCVNSLSVLIFIFSLIFSLISLKVLALVLREGKQKLLIYLLSRP